MSRRLLLPPLLLVVTAAILLAADWWICLPEGKTASYVGRQECARCHEKEMKAWAGSDHDRAMDLATPETVLGDFNDREFTHVPFEDLGRLSDGDLQTVLNSTADLPWAPAFSGADAGLKDKILAAMPRQTAARVSGEMDDLDLLRPADVAQAQDRIAQAAGNLKAAGKIATDFAVTSKFFRRDEKYYVQTDGPTGDLETFQIKYVFGVRPLQQYLVEFPDGRVQCLGAAWDTEKKRWFHLYAGERIPAGDQLHWTRPLQNWNYMCAECHSTNLQKNYDLAADSYHTTWSEIDVSCETCHGPGSLHVELADSWGYFWDRRYGFGLPNLKDPNPRVEIETCAPCHSRRRIVFPDKPAGAKFLDYYLPQILDNDLYYADGQVLEEDYVYGSFIQSKMYQKEVRCTNCHDPHTARIKFEDPHSPRVKYTDNRLCGQCHVPATYDTAAHHYHPDATKPGTKCVECHMPETTYMVVDPRRDHSLRVPRPDLTVWLGIPNACNGCHNDPAKGETPEWAEDWVQKWYGKREGPLHFAYAIDAGRKRTSEGEKQLAAVAKRKDASAVVRASAISLLSGYQSGAAEAAAFQGLEDPEGLVRATAVRSLQYLPPRELHRRLTPMLHDPLRAVRTEAARVLTQVPRRGFSRDEQEAFDFSRDDQEAFDAALGEYMEGLDAVADQAAAHLNKAVVYTNLNQLGKAEEEYQTALRLDPLFVPARVNLAMLCDQLGNKAEAEKQFRKVIELEPELAEAHYSLGLLLAENEDRLQEAAGFLSTAARLAPENPRIHYNRGLAFQKLGQPKEAEEALREAYRLAPAVPDFLYALAIFYAQQKQWDRAIACAGELVRMQPDSRQWPSFLRHLQAKSKGSQ